MAEKSLNKANAAKEDVKPEAAEPAAKKNPPPEKGCRIYIGPTVKGRVQYGTVFSSAAEAKKLLASELEVWPMMAGLLVSMEDLPKARLEVKTPGTARYVQAAQVRANLTKN